MFRTLHILFITILLSYSGAGLSAYAQTGRRYYTGDNTEETSFEQIPKSAERITRDLEGLPPKVSLRPFAPVPGDQGKTGTCVAWSASYAARTISYCIQQGISDPAAIQRVAFSPHYLYYYIKQPGDDECQRGAKVEPALKVLNNRGDVLLTDNVSACSAVIDAIHDQKAKGYSIKAYTSLTNQFGRLGKDDYLRIKKCLAEKNPVIFSIKCYSSLFDVGKDGIWNKPAVDTIVGNHALCIVGYDDARNGGSFEVMNSWGTEWGQGGFFWMTYDQLITYGSYALELMDRESYDRNLTSRGLGDPKITGSLEFVETDDAGNIVKPMPVVRSVVNENGEPSTDPAKAAFSYYRFSDSYPGGTTRFKILFTTNAPAFVYIFSLDDKGELSRMFPYADNVSPAINSYDATVILPLGTKRYRLNAGATTDRICVLYSKSPLDIEALKQAIKGSSGIPFYQLIRKQFGNKLIPLQKIKFQGDKIKFSTSAGEEELVCLFAELNHT
jgi:Papain family cysteine protease